MSARVAPARAGRSYRSASAAVCFALFTAIFASHVPSPLYAVYQARWGFSATTLTELFSVYCIAVLATLLLVGPVCDRVGRRQAIIPGLALVALGGIMLWWAPALPWLFAGRILSGIGTGCLTGAATAALVELDAAGDSKRAATISTLMLTAGGGCGPALSSLALYLDLWPTQLPFMTMAAMAALSAGLLALAPWPAQSLPADGFRLREWRPRRVSIPAEMLTPFALAAGAIGLAWATGSTLAVLGPSLAVNLLGVQDRGVAGLVTVALQVIGGVAQIAFGSHSARRTLTLGPGLLASGLVIAAAAFAMHSGAVFAIAIVVVSVGYGAAFVGSVAAVGQAAPAQRRGEVVSALYVAAYVAAAFPVIGAGLAVDAFGMLYAMLLVTAIVGVLAVVLISACLKRFPQPVGFPAAGATVSPGEQNA